MPAKLAYVMCQDLRSTVDPPNQIVMVVRAPPETQMQVSDPSEVRWSWVCSSVLLWKSSVPSFTYLYTASIDRVTRSLWKACVEQSTSSCVLRTAQSPVALWTVAQPNQSQRFHPNPHQVPSTYPMEVFPKRGWHHPIRAALHCSLPVKLVSV